MVSGVDSRQCEVKRGHQESTPSRAEPNGEVGEGEARCFKCWTGTERTAAGAAVSAVSAVEPALWGRKRSACGSCGFAEAGETVSDILKNG